VEVKTVAGLWAGVEQSGNRGRQLCVGHEAAGDDCDQYLSITWKVKRQVGQKTLTKDYGTSKNRVYVTGAAATNAFETVLDLGSLGASGKRPRNPGEAPAAGDAKDREVVDGVWGMFSGNTTKRVDGTFLMSLSAIFASDV
jgi:hypothetical protein